MRLPLPRRRAVNPLLVAAALALLAGCANGFDPLKIVIAPVTELMSQLDGMDKKSAQRQDESKGQNKDQNGKDQNGTTQPASATQVAATTAAPAKVAAPKAASPAKPAAAPAARPVAPVAKPAAPPVKYAQWKGLPLGEIQAGALRIMAVQATSDEEKKRAWEGFPSLSPNEGVLHSRPGNGGRLCPAGSTGEGVPVALSTAFLAEEGLILSIQSIDANGQECVPGGTRRMLFMPHGWFRENGFKAGDTVGAFKPITEEAAKPLLAKRTAVENETKRLAQLTARVELMRKLVGRGEIPQSVNIKEVTTGSASLAVFAKSPRYFPIFSNEGFVLGASPAKRHVYGPDSFQPLSIAYIDAAGRIVRLENVADYREDQVNNTMNAPHVLVTSLGWLESRGVKTGDTVSFKALTAKRLDELQAQGRKEAEALLARYSREEKEARIAATRQAGMDIDTLLQAGKAWHHGYQCLHSSTDTDVLNPKEGGQSLLYVQSRGADGSVSAIYDLLVADFDKKIVHNVRVQMQGRKDTDGAYTFTPTKTLKMAPGYKVNGIRAWGNMGELDVNLSGSTCGTAEQIGLWAKELGGSNQWSAGVTFNLAHRPLQRAEIFYGRTPNHEGKIAVRHEKEEAGLGVVLIAAGPALPGETAKTSHAVWVTDPGNEASVKLHNGENIHRVSGKYNTGENLYYADKITEQNCVDMRSTFPCVGNVQRNEQFRETASDNRHYADILSVKAAHSRKVAYTPDFAPDHELFWYEILPGQKINGNLKAGEKITGDNYYSPDDSESVVRFGYRYPRYVYFHALARRADQAREFLQNYMVKREDLKISRGGKVTQHNPLTFGPSSVQTYQGCADYTYTMSIKPKNTANRKPFDLNLLFTLEQTGEVHGIDRDGKPSTGHYTASNYSREYIVLNAKNNYTQTFPVTFKCVVEAEEGQTNHASWFYGIPTGTSYRTSRLKEVNLKTVFGGIYE